MIKPVIAQIISLFYLLLIFSVYIYKKRNNNIDSVTYENLLINTILVVCIDIATNIVMINYDNQQLYATVLGKIYLMFSIFWCASLLVYILEINNNTKYKSVLDLLKNERKTRLNLLLMLAFSAVVPFLKLTTVFDTKASVGYITGSALLYTLIIGFVYMGIIAIYIINAGKKMRFMQKIPILIFLFLGLSSIVIQWIYSSEHFISAIMSFSLLFIYFTLENPDLKIISELEKNNEEVMASSKAKTDFLSNMSHDIRTPMNAIIGFSESLLTEEMSEPQRVEVQNIYDAASTLLAIINNILDVSRIESGKEEKKENKYEFRKVVMQLVSVVTAKLDQNKIKFDMQIDKNVPAYLYGDELKIYQILMNLLSNAVKYTSEGQISFSVSSENIGDTARLKFIVSDTGIGIKESDYDKMFVKFSRLHNEENYNTIEGTGLGLVITKSLIELLGGTITFESEYGKGTTFTVVIPQKIIEIAADSVLESPVARNMSAVNVHFDGSLYDVLIVDDNDLNLKVAKRILDDYHFQITLASSGEEALSLLRSGKRFDLIFLDHMMPGMDGIETMHIMKSLENIKVPPVIALTANAMVGMKEMYLSEGFNGYISKPINRDELQALLNNVFCQK